MATITWANEGQADAKGMFKATVEVEGVEPQVFTGASHKEVADKLLQAQANASARIKELKDEKKTPVAAAGSEEVQFSADERFDLTHSLEDPNKAPEAISKIVQRTMTAEATRAKNVREAAERWVAETPDYVVDPHNQRLIEAYCRTNGKNLNAENLTEAWESIKKAGLAITKDDLPATEPTEEQPAGDEPAADKDKGGLPAPSTTRPRGSGGLRRGHSSPANPAATTKYTRAQIEEMPTKTFDDKLRNEPGFKELVDNMK